MLSIPYILLSFFRREKCLEFGFTLLAQSEEPFNRTGLLMRAFLVNLKSDLSGAHFRKFKEELKISRYDDLRWSLIDSPVNNVMYAFSPVFVRKILTQVFFDDVISIVMMSTEAIEGELFL